MIFKQILQGLPTSKGLLKILRRMNLEVNAHLTKLKRDEVLTFMLRTRNVTLI